MTKKDYVKAAKIVVEMRDVSDKYSLPRRTMETIMDQVDGAIIAFTRLFALDNPNFDEAKFREACNKGAK